MFANRRILGTLRGGSLLCFPLGFVRPPTRSTMRLLSTRQSSPLQSPVAKAAAPAVDNAVSHSSSSSSMTAGAFAELTPMVLLNSALQQQAMLVGTTYAQTLDPDANHSIITREEFDRLCAMSHVKDSQAALDALDEAAIVVSLDGGARVHLMPVQYLEELNVLEALQGHGASTASAKALSDLAMPPLFFLSQVEERIRALEAREAAMRRRLEPAIAKAARWRRSVWGGALMYAGAQLAVIARLTYFDLNWDIMEPVSYFLTVGTALVFLLYYLWYDVDHTYSDFDRRFLPRRVHRYAPADFDWKAYDALCRELHDERAVRERLRKWSHTH